MTNAGHAVDALGFAAQGAPSTYEVTLLCTFDEVAEIRRAVRFLERLGRAFRNRKHARRGRELVFRTTAQHAAMRVPFALHAAGLGHIPVATRVLA